MNPDDPVRIGCAEPRAASVAERPAAPRHHIGQFSTPQKGYFAATPLAPPDRLLIVRWSESGNCPKPPAPTPFGRASSMPTTEHAMRGVGIGLGARDRIVTAWPSWAAGRSPQPRSKATMQGDEVRIVVDRTRCVGMGICEGIDPEQFQVQSDGKSSAPIGQPRGRRGLRCRPRGRQRDMR